MDDDEDDMDSDHDHDDETLIPDPRGAMTPAQWVDLWLLNLLGGANPGLFVQAGRRKTRE